MKTLILSFIFFFGFSYVTIAQDIILNEILADPAVGTAGDANGDGTRDFSDDEFVEIYNNGPTDLDISGWTISDGVIPRHVFPDGSILPVGGFAVVFGGGTPTDIPGDIVQVASTSALGLNNGGDDITVTDSGGTIQLSYTYGAEAGDNQSIGRSPDFTGAFSQHSVIPPTGRFFSPGEPNSIIIIDIILNEFLADPAVGTAGDANGDGTRDFSDDEFVEIYNNGPTDLDISGWTISDGVIPRHVFPDGSILPVGGFAVVFGGGIPTDIPGDIVQVASTGALGLNNGGDDITVTDSGGTIQLSYTYGAEAGNNQSIGRFPDFTGDFTEHSIIPPTGRLFSPGKRNEISIHSATVDVCTTADGPIMTTMNNDWVPITHQGELIAEIHDLGNNMGEVNADFYISTTPREDASGTNYLNRTLFITPTNNIPAQVRFYFTEQELESLISDSAGDTDPVISVDDLILSKVDQATCSANIDVSNGTLIQPVAHTFGSDYYLEFSVTGFSSFSVSGGAGALPVELAHFHGESTGSSVELEWETLSEQNSSHFEVQHSEDGMSWDRLGLINASGFSDAPVVYGFTDQTPVKGYNYYRLKQVDFDGSFEYSEIIRISFGGDLDIQHLAAEDVLSIEVYNPSVNELSYRLYSIGGQLLLSGKSSSGRGINSIQEPIGQLSSGIYILYISNQEQHITHQFFY